MSAKFNLLVAASVPAVALVPLLACGGGGGGTKDAPVIVTHDTSSPDAPAGCKWGSNLDLSAFSAQGVFYDAANTTNNSGPSNRLDFDGVFGGSANTPNEEVFRVVILSGCGATGTGCTGGSALDATPDWPNVFTQKTGIVIGPGSDNIIGPPDIAILLLGDLVGNTYSTVYIAVAANVDINQAANGSGHTFAGSATNLDFLHFDGNMVAADQCETLVSHVSWSGSARFDGKDYRGGDLPAGVQNFLHHRTSL